MAALIKESLYMLFWLFIANSILSITKLCLPLLPFLGFRVTLEYLCLYIVNLTKGCSTVCITKFKTMETRMKLF